MEPVTLLIVLTIGIIFLFILTYFIPVNLWITAIFSGVKVELFELVFMRIRKTPPKLIINNLISLQKSGIHVAVADLEMHYLAGGDVERTAKAMIVVKNLGQKVSWKEVAALNLAGVDIENYFRKKKLEVEGGIDQLRIQLSSAILHDLDTEEVKELARVVERMRSLSS